mgnify:CR=1 FL=1
MGSGGGGGGGGGSDNAFTPDRRQREIEESNRREAERQEKDARNRARSEANRAKVLADKKIAAEKKAEVGVKYTAVSTPKGGVKTEASIRKTSPKSGELARKTGVSPSDVLATVGTLPTVDRDTAAANIAGRTDVNVATLGDLSRRAREGNMLLPVPTPTSAILSVIGRQFATRRLTSLAKDQPTIGADGRINYSTSIVNDPRGGIGGLVTTKDGRTSYEGLDSLNPSNKEPENKDTPIPPKPKTKIEDEPDEVLPIASSGKSTKAGRGKSGRGVAFGTRRSLVNLRSLGKRGLG